MAFSNGLDMARQNGFITVEEQTFLIPDTGGNPIFRVDVGDDGNGFSEVANWITHTADGKIMPISRNLVGKEGMITRTFMPQYRTMEYVIRGLIGLPTSDTLINGSTQRQVVWNYPEKFAPAVASVTGYYGLESGSIQMSGGLLQSFNIDVNRNADGGSVSGQIAYHFNRVNSYSTPIPNVTAQPEIQTFTFSNTPELARLGTRFLGGTTITDTGAWISTTSTAVATSASTTAGITYTGSGSLTSTGSTPARLYSGVITDTASTNVMATQVEIVRGAEQNFTVATNTATGNYTINGSANFAAGDATSAIQTKLQATAGLWTGVTVDGTSTAATSGTPSVPVFDAVSNGATTGSSTSRTWSHTVGAGLNRFLVVSCDAGVGNTTTGVTYNGVAMTQIVANVSASQGGISNWGLVAPATGTFNIVASFSGSVLSACTATSYSSVDQVTQMDATPVINEVTSGSTSTSSITTVSANSMLFGALFANSGGLTVTPTTSGSVARGSVTTVSQQVYTAEKATTTAGSSALAWSLGSSVNHCTILMAIRGFAAPATLGSFNLQLRFPASVGAVTLGIATGTGAVMATTITGGLTATTITSATTQQGGNGLGSTQLTGPYLEANHVRVYIATSDSDLATINYATQSDQYGGSNESHLVETSPASTISFGDIWKPFYAQNAKIYATDFVPGARTFGGSITLPNDPTSGSDADYMRQTETGCAATGYWYCRDFTCGLYTFRTEMFVSRESAPTYSADNDVYLIDFPFGRQTNANSTIGTCRITLILPNP